MNDGLIDAFGHNSWATSEMLEVCRGLTDEQLEATVEGTFGSIIETLRHIVSSDAVYLTRLSGELSGWDWEATETGGLDTLAAQNNTLAFLWGRFLAEPFDAEPTFVIEWDDGADRDVPAGIILAQALHHSNEHRAQVLTILTQIGVTPPELGVWEYAAATDRAPQRLPGD